MSHDNEEKKQPWQQIQTELKSALDTWSELSVKVDRLKSPEKSPPEKQLEEIRELLGQLQNKIKDFEQEA